VRADTPWKSLLGLGLALLAGFAVGVGAMPALFGAAANDFRRIDLLFRALRETSPPPDLLVFGNSVTMNGIDARAFEGAVPDVRTALNFASTGQSIAEAFLLYQEIPAATKRVVYAIPADALESNVAFNPHAYNAFVMYGYEAEPATLAALRESYAAVHVADLDRSWLEQRIEARWVFRTVLDKSMRGWVRPDLNLDRAFRDLRYPAAYTHRLPEARLRDELAQRVAIRPPGALRVSDPSRRLLAELVRSAQRDDRRIALALAPIHPAFREAWGAEFVDSVRAFAATFEADTRVQVIDATTILEDAQFVDSVHPGAEGAARWTRKIAAALADRG
jgi:hypothetical protein